MEEIESGCIEVSLQVSLASIRSRSWHLVSARLEKELPKEGLSRFTVSLDTPLIEEGVQHGGGRGEQEAWFEAPGVRARSRPPRRLRAPAPCRAAGARCARVPGLARDRVRDAHQALAERDQEGQDEVRQSGSGELRGTYAHGGAAPTLRQLVAPGGRQAGRPRRPERAVPRATPRPLRRAPSCAARCRRRCPLRGPRNPRRRGPRAGWAGPGAGTGA